MLNKKAWLKGTIKRTHLAQRMKNAELSAAILVQLTRKLVSLIPGTTNLGDNANCFKNSD